MHHRFPIRILFQVLAKCLDRRQLARMFGMAGLTLYFTTVACAQFDHSDVGLGLRDGKIFTEQSVYMTSFPTFGISKQFTSNPGFAAESDGAGTLGGKVDLVYDVLDNLQYWDGTQMVTPADEIQIRITNNPPASPETYVNSRSGVQLGSAASVVNRIGASSASGEVHSHVSYSLEPLEEAPPSGAYGLKLALSTDSDDILPSDPFFVVFNFGLASAQLQSGLAAFEALLTTTPLLGDLDNSGSLDVGDIDLLTGAVRDNNASQAFDLNRDGHVDAGDRSYWIEHLSETYLGDANLDGQFNSGDFVAVFTIGEYEDGVSGNSTWAEGDWNGDSDFDTSDFVAAFQAGGYELGPRSAVYAVPEPSGVCSVAAGIALLGCTAARRLRLLAPPTLHHTTPHDRTLN